MFDKLGKHSISKDRCVVPIIIVLFVLMLSVLVFHQYLGKNDIFASLHITSDLIRANLPTYTLLFDYLSNGFHYWSWEMGLGTTIFSHADVIFDPFTYITFLGGRDNIAYMMGWSLIVKVIFEGLTFSLYLNHFKLDKRAIIIASIAYAFCGYSLIMGNNLALGTILVYAPLLLLSIEKMIEEKKVVFLIVTLILISLLSYYYFFIAGIISVLYIAFRLKFDFKKIIKPVLVTALIGLIVIAITSPVLLPQLDMALSSPRSLNKDTLLSIDLLLPNMVLILQCIARSFLPDMLGTASDMLYSDYYSGEWFVPCLSMPLITYYVIKERNKELLITILAIILIASLPITSFIFNAFSTINYRWMFIIELFICVLCAFAINDILKNGFKFEIFRKSVVISVGILIGSVLIWTICKGIPITSIVDCCAIPLLLALAIMFIVLLFVYLTTSNKIKLKKIGSPVFALFMIIVIASTAIGYSDWYGDSNPVAEFDNGSVNGYDGWDKEIIDSIQENDKSEFYRIYKEFDSVYDFLNIPSDNDSMVQSYYGLKCYNSMNNGSYVKFLQTMGVYVCCVNSEEKYKELGIEPKDITGPDLNYINGIDEKKGLLDYLGVKYYMVKITEMSKVPSNFELISTYHDIAVYRNNNYNQLGFVNSHYMDYSEFITYDYDKRIELIQKYTILSDLSDVKSTDNSSECELISFKDDYVSFNAKIIDGSQYVSFSIPYDKNWHVYVDGKEETTERINISLLGVRVSEGEHTIELKYDNEMMNIGIVISTITIVCCLCLIAFRQIFLVRTKETGL